MDKKSKVALRHLKQRARIPMLLASMVAGMAISPIVSADAQSSIGYISMVTGKGTSPAADDTVRVHYRGTLADGSVFDSTYGRGEPVEFMLDQVIPCWTEGVQKMKPGGKARLICPPETAYGEYGAGMIPPNATLTFEIDLIAVKGQPETTAAMQEEIAAYTRIEKERQEQKELEAARKIQQAQAEAKAAESRKTQDSFSKMLGTIAAGVDAYAKYKGATSGQGAMAAGGGGIRYDIDQEKSQGGATVYRFYHMGCVTIAATGVKGSTGFIEKAARMNCGMEVQFSYYEEYSGSSFDFSLVYRPENRNSRLSGFTRSDPVGRASLVVCPSTRIIEETVKGHCSQDPIFMKKPFAYCECNVWKPVGTAN